MLSIGEFSNICRLPIKTLRYYSDIELVVPEQVNPQTGYRYYSINQLEQVLYITRLKSYNFSLEEIKRIMDSSQDSGDFLMEELLLKQKEIEKTIEDAKNRVVELQRDIDVLKEGKSIMSYMDNIDVALVEFPKINILSTRKKIRKKNMALEYQKCFNKLLNRIITDELSVLSKPMALFHSREFSDEGIDTEFAIQIEELVTGTRDFEPKLCLKSTHSGPYSELPSVYTKQLNFAEKEGYIATNALFEIYITDPSEVEDENLCVTEVYLPVKKQRN